VFSVPFILPAKVEDFYKKATLFLFLHPMQTAGTNLSEEKSATSANSETAVKESNSITTINNSSGNSCGNNPIVEALPELLSRVENPARYMGGEANGLVKDPETVKASVALTFPDAYELGMSNNGFRILGHMINNHPDYAAEYAFAPLPDMAEQLRKHKLPLYTHQSYRPIKEFDITGISLQSELNFTNVPWVLELADIPIWAKDRNESDPLVIGGGPSMANPEPIADFFDAIALGDGEAVILPLLDAVAQAKSNGKSRAELLNEIANIEGMYVPSLLATTQSEQNTIIPEEIAKGSYERWQGLKRVWVPELNADQYPRKNLIPNTPLVQDRFAVEVMRGCTQGCRFCQAGYWYRPSRELHPDQVIDIAKEGLKNTGERELALLSLSSADYGPIEPLVDAFIDDDSFHGTDISLPSLRANSFGQSLASKVAAMKGGRSATFAPETGSARLRKAINKTISDQDMYDAAEGVFSSGFTKIKLYTMVGFPTEDLQDMEQFCDLITKLRDIGKKYGKRNQVHANIGILIPKAFTPLQWAPFVEKEKVMEHIYYVKDHFRHDRNVRITWAGWEEARLEAFYSRGDRGLAPMIAEAAKRNMVFESDSRLLNIEGWETLWKDFSYDIDAIHREHEKDEVFPWDFMHIGVTKGYLRKEYQAFFNPESPEVPDCKWGECQHCGIPGNYKDVKLAQKPEKYQAPSRSNEEIAQLKKERRKTPADIFHYRLFYRKRGLSSFLPHQNTLSIIERSLQRAGLPLRLSEGFNPRPKIHNSGALPLGLESAMEIISVELVRRIDLTKDSRRKLLDELNKMFPGGMEIIEIQERKNRKLAMAQWMDYEMLTPINQTDLDKAISLWEKGEDLLITNHRGKEFDLRREILDVSKNEIGNLQIRAQANHMGNTVSPFLLFSGLLQIPEQECRERRILKLGSDIG